MDTKQKPERVKWEANEPRVGYGWRIKEGELVIAVCDPSCRYDPESVARQIVHEHNTWGELLEACKDLIALYSHVAPYGQSPVVGAAKAALVATEKEEG